MQEVSQEWINNQKKMLQNRSYVRIHIFDADGNEFYTATNDNIFSFTMEQEVYYLNDNLPKYEVQFSLDNIDGIFDIDNEKGYYSKLKIRNRIVVDIGYDLDDGTTEWIKGGTYYLSEWTVSQNSLTAEFTANDWLSFLTNELYDDITQYVQGGCDLETNIRRALVGDPSYKDSSDKAILGFDSITLNKNVVVKSKLDDILSDASFETQSINELVQLLATAGASTIWMDRDNILHIDEKALTESTNYEITANDAFEYPEITLYEDLKDIIVNTYTYENNPTSQNGAIEDGDTSCVLFNKHVNNGSTRYSSENVPHYSWSSTTTKVYSNSEFGKYNSDNSKKYYDSTTSTSSGTTFNDYIVSVSYIDRYTIQLSIVAQSDTTSFPSSANLIFYSCTYTTTTEEYTLSVGDSGCTITIDNQFITDESIAKEVASWVGAYSKNRREIEVSFCADPRLDALDTITIFKKYGGTEKVLVERIKYTWSGGMFHGELRGRSIE